ncbi:hypothetical protein HPB49_003699 [Dermacentor silvarum]|uniref:Uncharacterized protein n=1 Tax=Dermacentor silvarum TaxID=543639 RepID=A0ACB8CUV3_DERSI|nr:hypothetical protein HPB49_003699 [Dermacentor silvarum]
MAKGEKMCDALRDLIIAEQFMKGCSPALRIFLKERNCKELSMMAQNADCFLEAQDLSSLANDNYVRTLQRRSVIRLSPRRGRLEH